MIIWALYFFLNVECWIEWLSIIVLNNKMIKIKFTFIVYYNFYDFRQKIKPQTRYFLSIYRPKNWSIVKPEVKHGSSSCQIAAVLPSEIFGPLVAIYGSFQGLIFIELSIISKRNCQFRFSIWIKNLLFDE